MRRTTTLTLADGTEVEVVRSTRRRRSVSAYREAGRTVLMAPERMSAADLRAAAEELHARLVARERKRRPSDAGLLARSIELAQRWLGGTELPDTVRWVGNMTTRWASCTPVDRAIRVSDRLRDAPGYVLDYVLLHELAHLIEAGHNARFWALLEPYPRTGEARAWLEGFTAGQRLAPSDEEPVEPEPIQAPGVEMPPRARPPSEPKPPTRLGQGELFPLGGSPASSSADRSSGADRSA